MTQLYVAACIYITYFPNRSSLLRVLMVQSKSVPETQGVKRPGRPPAKNRKGCPLRHRKSRPPLPVACCLLPVALCPLPFVFCPLPFAFCPLPFVLCPLPVALCPLPSALSPFALFPLPFTICPLPFALCPLPFARFDCFNKVTF